jgi:type IV secretion system protein VirB10
MSKNNETTTQEEIVEPEIQNELSKVATNPKKSFAILASAIVVLGYVSYSILFPSGATTNVPVDEPLKAPEKVVKAATSNIPDVPELPKLPEIPKLVAPNVAPPKPLDQPKSPTITAPIEPAVAPTLPEINTQDNQDKVNQKRKANIMLMNNPQTKPVVTPQEAEQMEAFKSRADLKFLLSKGKIIEVILETAINTDHPSEIMGIVSRDVFAEDGETKLIPKGSKIFGSFKTTVDDIYGIISIDWNRIDLASGYSLMFSGNSVDNLGRTGVQGRLDNKHKETISANMLSSAINIGLAQLTDKVIVPGTNTVDATNNQLLSQSLASLATTSSTTLAPEVAAGDPKAPTDINTTCTQGLQLFKDTTMQAYKDLSAQCTTLLTKPAGSDGKYTDSYNLLMSSLQAASTSVATNNVTQSSANLTQTQTAFQTAATDMGNTIKDMLTSKKYTPNITLNQGTLIRVYINKDYTFPKKALNNINIIQ